MAGHKELGHPGPPRTRDSALALHLIDRQANFAARSEDLAFRGVDVASQLAFDGVAGLQSRQLHGIV